MTQIPVEDRLAGALLGCAVGDALGLPAEGLSPKRIAARFGTVDRYRLWGSTGFVSDDTEQSALMVQSFARGGPDGCVAQFRRALVGWFWRLPFGIGLSTLRACLRLSFGLRPSGIPSAGNGAAMRAGALGVVLADDVENRRALTRRLAALTHTDARAVEGALYVAEVSARLAQGVLVDQAVALARAEVVSNPELGGVLDAAVHAAAGPASPSEAAARLGTTGYVVHTLGTATFGLLRFRGGFAENLSRVVALGGDTDTIGAIVGTWWGAMGGAASLPPRLVDNLHDGPFGPRHLRALAAAVTAGRPPPEYSALAALLRNLVLYPVILGHGFRRLLWLR